MIKFEDMSVEYVDHMGSDLSVVNAARVSFDKKSDVLSEKDEKLIAYLAKHNHWTPFGHTSLCLKIKAPIYVARQLAKHQVGLVWNEVSRRYVSDEPTFYRPDTWRAAAENVKQGSSDTQTVVRLRMGSDIRYSFTQHMQASLYLYNELIACGTSPEQARSVLPLSVMTEWMWTGSLAAWARVLGLRLDPHTQKETRDVAAMILPLVEQHFPISTKALRG